MKTRNPGSGLIILNENSKEKKIKKESMQKCSCHVFYFL
jgi:hypothetical protein